MSGFLRRIRSARTPAADPAPDEGAAWPAEEPTREQPAGDAGGVAVPAVPAGTDLDVLVGERPTTRRRGRLRRRLRHLRRVREVLLRDLGGLMFEIHRSGLDSAAGAAHEQVARKLHRLAGLDAELRELEEILDDRRGMVLREPGLGGACPNCGELYGTEARFCWACGMPLVPGAAHPFAPLVRTPQLEPAAPAPTAVWAAPPQPPAPPPPDEAPTAVTEPLPQPPADDEAHVEEAHVVGDDEPAPAPEDEPEDEPAPAPEGEPAPEPAAEDAPAEPAAEDAAEPEPAPASEPDPAAAATSSADWLPPRQAAPEPPPAIEPGDPLSPRGGRS